MIDSSIRGYGAFFGGAIYNNNFSNTRLEGSTLSGNAAMHGGGAIYNIGFAFVTDGSRLDGNGVNTRGGGVYNAGGGLYVTDSIVSNNHAGDGDSGWGGGVYAGTGRVELQRSTFSGNEALNSGGGLYLEELAGTAVDNSTFHGNVAHHRPGGGIGVGGGSATITNSTVTGNRTVQGGGGGGVQAWGPTTIRGSIVAGNTTVSGNPDVQGNYTNEGFNIIGGTAGDAGLMKDANGAPVLADNGGPTQTVVLVRSSKAIDAGSSFGATTDQRGMPRPKDYASIENAQGGDGSDIGAFEYIDPDAMAPTINASRSPLPDEGGLNNSDVTVSMTATDEAGGSGVWRTSYSTSGAQQVSEQNVSGNSAELVVSAEGETVVSYWATDQAGNRSEPRTLIVNLDKILPETSITSGPSGSVKSTSASFGFSSNETGATFECSLDDSAFEACTSPKDYSALAGGEHTFSVRAKDAAGNVDSTPAVRSWMVDTIKPTVSSMSPRHKSVIRDTTPTITATVKDRLTNLQKRNIKVFVAGKAIPASKFRYSAATDKLTYNSPKLPKGKKTVKIVATDAAKNVGTKSWYFTIR